MSNQARWGIIGLGNVAKKFVKSFNKVKNAKLVAIASTDQKKLEQFSKILKIDKNLCFNNYIDLLKSKDLDIVYISLPNSLHVKWILQGLKNNKNVLCEKPLAVNSKEIKKIDKILKNKNLFLREAYMYLYHPVYQKILSLIKLNKIGKVKKIKAYFGTKILKKNFFGFGRYKINYNDRKFSNNLGGGVILDLGCYPMSFVIFLKKFLRKKTGKINFYFKNKKVERLRKIEIEAFLKINFSSSLDVEMGCSFINNLKPKIEIFGDKGKILVEDPWLLRKKKYFLNKKKLNIYNKFPSIYSYEIEAISNFFLTKKEKKFTFDFKDSIENLKMLEKWRYDCK